MRGRFRIFHNEYTAMISAATATAAMPIVVMSELLNSEVVTVETIVTFSVEVRFTVDVSVKVTFWTDVMMTDKLLPVELVAE